MASLRFTFGCWYRLAWGGPAAGLIVSILLPIVGLAAETSRRSFDLPEDTAERSLKRFATQAGLQLIFASAHTEGVRTNAVKGDWAPLDAIDHLLAGTPLRATHDKRTGIVSVVRISSSSAADVAKKKTRQTSLNKTFVHLTTPYLSTHP